MELKLKGNVLECLSSGKKEKYYSETAFYHTVKKALQGFGLDVIKIGQKGIAKDGHLISNDYILTHRKRLYCFYDNEYALRLINKDFNEKGKVELVLHLLNCETMPEELNQLKEF